MLEPPAFEEGVVERYPFFLSIVLNHASEATPVFWNALHCLKLLLEVLGKPPLHQIDECGRSKNFCSYHFCACVSVFYFYHVKVTSFG